MHGVIMIICIEVDEMMNIEVDVLGSKSDLVNN